MPVQKLSSKAGHKRKADEEATKAREKFAAKRRKQIRQKALEQLAAAAQKKKTAQHK